MPFASARSLFHDALIRRYLWWIFNETHFKGVFTWYRNSFTNEFVKNLHSSALCRKQSQPIQEYKLYNIKGYFLFCFVRARGDNCLQVIYYPLFYCHCKDRRMMKELDSGYQGSVCELQQSWPWREEPGRIALVNDWWHLQDMWSLKVTALLKPH